jgi:hypothetical protein
MGCRGALPPNPRDISGPMMGRQALDHDALDLVEADLVVTAVVEAGGAGTLVVGHLLGDLRACRRSCRYSVMPVARNE